jgi:hypothetical protein
MQDARAQEPPPQPTQAQSSFLPIFGQR